MTTRKEESPCLPRLEGTRPYIITQKFLECNIFLKKNKKSFL